MSALRFSGTLAEDENWDFLVFARYILALIEKYFGTTCHMNVQSCQAVDRQFAPYLIDKTIVF